MMTEKQAIDRALYRAKQTGQIRYVVMEPDEDGNYHVTTDEGLATYWAGAPVLAAVSPTGEIDR